MYQFELSIRKQATAANNNNIIHVYEQQIDVVAAANRQTSIEACASFKHFITIKQIA